MFCQSCWTACRFQKRLQTSCLVLLSRDRQPTVPTLYVSVRGRSLTKTSATERSNPAPSIPFVKRIEGLLSACDLHGNDRNIRRLVPLASAFCR